MFVIDEICNLSEQTPMITGHIPAPIIKAKNRISYTEDSVLDSSEQFEKNTSDSKEELIVYSAIKRNIEQTNSPLVGSYLRVEGKKQRFLRNDLSAISARGPVVSSKSLQRTDGYEGGWYADWISEQSVNNIPPVLLIYCCQTICTPNEVNIKENFIDTGCCVPGWTTTQNDIQLPCS